MMHLKSGLLSCQFQLMLARSSVASGSVLLAFVVAAFLL